jgi:hypothetical protein
MMIFLGYGLRLVLLATVLLGSCGTGARAQDTLYTARLREYESEKKNAVVAGALEYAFPFAGYAYAGNWRQGVWPGAMYITGFALMLPCAYSDLEPCSTEQQQRLVAGVFLLVASRIWGTVGAAHTASAHNRALRERLQIEPARTRDGLALRLGLRVPL